jgi:hypothetical protein
MQHDLAWLRYVYELLFLRAGVGNPQTIETFTGTWNGQAITGLLVPETSAEMITF